MCVKEKPLMFFLAWGIWDFIVSDIMACQQQRQAS